MAQRIPVTGCSSGIGRTLAAELSGRGHHVIATAMLNQSMLIRSEDHAEGLAAVIDKRRPAFKER
ncbi:MAG: hypothetical protein M0R03_05710 [Novosphingobium sp.]|nr:hypothetical protein [Novosphingobium sp.]